MQGSGHFVFGIEVSGFDAEYFHEEGLLTAASRVAGEEGDILWERL